MAKKSNLKEQEKRIKELENQLKNLNKEKNTTISSGLRMPIKTISPISTERFIASEGIKKPISNTNKMWLMSVWENRKELDPEGFDPDNWFNSSYWLDNNPIHKKVNDFWTGESIQESKNRNADDFWMGKSMWEK